MLGFSLFSAGPVPSSAAISFRRVGSDTLAVVVSRRFGDCKTEGSSAMITTLYCSIA